MRVFPVWLVGGEGFAAGEGGVAIWYLTATHPCRPWLAAAAGRWGDSGMFVAGPGDARFYVSPAYAMHCRGRPLVLANVRGACQFGFPGTYWVPVL